MKNKDKSFVWETVNKICFTDVENALQILKFKGDFPTFLQNISANGHDTNFGVTLVSRPYKFHVYKFAFAELNFVSLAEEINEIIQICETR